MRIDRQYDGSVIHPGHLAVQERLELGLDVDEILALAYIWPRTISPTLFLFLRYALVVFTPRTATSVRGRPRKTCSPRPLQLYKKIRYWLDCTTQRQVTA
ncbi:hypothetical protein ACLOJK_013311 [Asimina triloba]